MRKIWPNLGDVLPMVMGKAFFKTVNPPKTHDNDGYTLTSPCAKLCTWEADVHASSPSRPSVSLQSHVPSKPLIPHLPLNPVFYAITLLTGHTYIFSKDFGCWEWKKQKSVAVPLCMNFSVLPPLGSNPELPNLPAWFPIHNDLSVSPLSYPLFTSSYIFWGRRFTFWVMWKHLLDMMEIYELWLPAPPPGPRKATPDRGWGGESRVCR